MYVGTLSVGSTLNTNQSTQMQPVSMIASVFTCCSHITTLSIGLYTPVNYLQEFSINLTGHMVDLVGFLT